MHVFWITSRAAGIAAVLFASLSVGLGLAMAARVVRGRLKDPRALHEALSLATLAALAIHTLSLLGDSFISLSLADVAVPFVSSYHPVEMAIGIVAAYALVVLSLTYYVRDRIGVARWRTAHRFIVVAWAAGVLHGLLLGTDATRPWFLAAVGAVALPTVALLAWRWTPEEASPA